MGKYYSKWREWQEVQITPEDKKLEISFTFYNIGVYKPT